MRRRWSTTTRVAIAVLVVTLLHWPIADYKWTIFNVKGYDPVTGANPVYVVAPVGDFSASIAEHTWLCFDAVPETLVGAVAAIGVFALLGRWVGAGHGRETLCRRCGQVLKGLAEPACPACGEHL